LGSKQNVELLKKAEEKEKEDFVKEKINKAIEKINAK